MTEQRKFASALRPGMAAQLRESVSEVVRQTTSLCKPVLVEPIDFETFILKNKTLIQNDPHRELLLYPNDDVSEIIYPKKFRTLSSCMPTTKPASSPTKGPAPKSPTKNVSSPAPVPLQSTPPQCHLLTREALNTYQSANHIVNYKYKSYSYTSAELPRNRSPEKLKEEVYEVDADPDQIDEQMTRSQADSITKQGYLLKGPDTNAERMLAHIGSKSFKRRYCYLRQEIDGTYILEIHKDEKQIMAEAKTTIVMDFCTEIVLNAKRGPKKDQNRFCFELQMTTGHKSFVFATDDETEYDDWLKKLQSVLAQNKLQDDKRAASLERAPPSPNHNGSGIGSSAVGNNSLVYGTLKGLEQSMNPQLIKYGRETDLTIAQARKENRKKLFLTHLYASKLPGESSPAVTPTIADNLEIYKEPLLIRQRILLKCEQLKFRLMMPLENENGKMCQIEPYITSLALYDAKAGRKLTENFYFELNEEHLQFSIATSSPPVLPKSPKTNGAAKVTNGTSTSNGTSTTLLPDLNEVSKEWLMRPREAVISVTAPHPDVFVVVKIEKILQGNIQSSTEPYLKAMKDPKLCQKLQKTIKQYGQKVGHYRMPWAWAARPLFRLYSSELDTILEFPAIYRQEVNRLRDEDLLKLLAEYRKPEKFSKLTVIPGTLHINVEQLQESPQNALTTGLSPIRPFTTPPKAGPTMEIVEFPSTSERDAFPYTTFVNHLFIYPLSLNFDSQKLFSRARNIAVLIEIKDSDAEHATPLTCLYGRPGQLEPLVSQISCPVLHHNANPTFYEEIKARLPLALTSQHHILFSFLHVSCNIKKKEEKEKPETPVGYAWMPLLNKGRMNIEEQCLPIAATLPPGYLSIQPLGLGRGNAGPEIQWIDNQKPLFQVNFRLDSTVLTTDQHLHNLFTHVERILEHHSKAAVAAMPAESETCKILKAAHAIQITSLITFLPTILNQLFTLLVNTNSEEIGLNVIRLLVNLIHVVAEEAGRRELILAYVKYVFRSISRKSKPNTSPQVPAVTVHGELAKCLPTLLHPNNTDFLLVNKFMKYSSIFFDLIVKSMAQFLLMTGRIKMHRNERFPKDFLQNIENLFQVLIPYLISRHKDLPDETLQLNYSIAAFVKKCLTYMDRGFVFKLIRIYMSRWSPGDPRTLQEFKFTFLQELCSHEHYIPLNLPFLVPSSPQHQSNGNNAAAAATGANIQQHFTLSEEFCRHHFLAGLLLQEVKGSLNEVAHIRKKALGALQELLAKHDLDDRYQNKGQLARIAMLYIPWLGIVLENLSRISDGSVEIRPHHRKHDSIATSRLSCNESFVLHRESSPSAITTPTNGISTSTPKSKRLTLHIEHPSPLRASVYLKDQNYLAAIAGQPAQSTTIISAPILSNGNGHSTNSLTSDSECSTLSQDTTVIRNNAANGLANGKSHARSISVTQPNIMPRTDKFSATETKSMLIAFLFVVKHIQPEHLLQWWRNCTESETIQFFTVLDMCLLYFRYVGKKNVVVTENVATCGEQLQRSTRSAKASTLPARMFGGGGGDSDTPIFERGTMNHPQSRELFIDEALRLQQALLSSNMATEVGMIILDCMGYYALQFRDSLLESSVLPKVANVYLRFLQLGLSESLAQHVFAALRAFINNFSQALFRGNALLCGQIVYELLKCCDNRLQTIRQEACAVLYLLMRSNFEFSGQKSLTRVHLQTIISVSQMVGNVIGLNNARFQESLSVINSYASSDKAMRGTGFPGEVKDLTHRVRTVLMATAQMQAHHMDPERLLELQYSLANSYASTPELRHTWLVTMARNHEQNGNISEAACCYLHISALIAEFLKLKGEGFVKYGAEEFSKISSNIPKDEKGLKLDISGGVHDTQYTEQLLLDQLRECAEILDRAERFECLGELYRMIIPILEHRRDYVGLANCYEHLMHSYNRVVDFNRSGKRLLGRFYRVTCFGQIYFGDEHGVEYIYKEPKVTTLSEISERLHRQYREKFGVDSVKMIMDSAPVDESSLDPKIVYIQITHVMPYYCKDELEDRQNDFEQNHDVDTFMYETPFTKTGGTARGGVENQWKRRTILRTQYSFPYVLKRIQVKERSSTELAPIEVAIDEMQAKIVELEDVILGPIDIKKLQLRLQGSVAVQVNAGPLAYASTFLDSQLSKKYPKQKVEELKEHFREFHRLCYTALEINGRLICNDQREYQLALKENFQALCVALSDMLGESFYLDEDNNNAHRNSLALFSAISGAPNNSSTA